jgi:Flp pilus assembly protein TadG
MVSESEYGKDRGAVLVETAFILVLLMMLLVGTVSGAIALGRDNSIQNAAREASRFGATLDGGGTLPWFTDVRNVARAAALGDLEASVPNEQICVAYITKGGTATHVTDNAGAPDPLVILAEACPGFIDGRTNEARVNIVVQRDTPFNVILWSTDLTLVAEAGARYERREP